MPLKRALISVYDKTGILDLATWLVKNGVELISTGGTFNYLSEHGLPVSEVSALTQSGAMLDGRVKTLHPQIHAAILAKRDNPHHLQQLDELAIAPIDMVVVNLYPFFQEVNKEQSLAAKLEFIDIGGPTMLRAAAKNFQDVVVVSDPQDYTLVAEELINHEQVSLATRKRLAAKAFNLTAAYDAAISSFLFDDELFPEYVNISYRKVNALRYGENPHQHAAFYQATTSRGVLSDFTQLQGKELSYNNMRDMDLAWKVVAEFSEICACGVKHSTPCGVAIAASALDAYTKMFASDAISIFGGIVALNCEVDLATAQQMQQTFLEIIMAPSFSAEALMLLKSKPNLRLIQVNCQMPQAKIEYLSVDGGLLVQTTDNCLAMGLTPVTNTPVTAQQLADLTMALKVVKHVKLNAIVIVEDGVTRGIGGGQTNRIWATEQALARAGGRGVLASDAFFPFRDCVDACAQAGIRAIVQPGGSLRDQESIDAANEHGIAMLFSKIRHFKH